MLRVALCSLLGIIGVLTGDRVDGDEVFRVIAADSKRQQALNVRIRIDSNGGVVIHDESLPLGFKGTSVAHIPNSRRLVVSSAALDLDQQSAAATIEINANGSLTLVAKSNLPTPTGYTSVDRSGRFFLTANYATGAVAVYRLGEDGSVGDQVCLLKTPHKEAHCILTTPDNRFAYIPCVKNSNALFQFRFDSESGVLTANDPIDASPPAMFGPRHVAYHPALPIAYFSNEQQLGVSVYGIGDSGRLTGRQHAATMPRRTPFVQGKRDLHASDLVITPDGTYLFVAVRDFEGDEDSVFTFRIESDGRLSQLTRTPVGDIPWKLDLSPSGGHLLVSEAFDRSLSLWKITAGGDLTRAAQVDWDAEIRDMVVVDSQ